MRGEEKIVYKYKLFAQSNFLELVRGSKFLLFGVQGGVPTVWFEVPRSGAQERVLLKVMPTGESFNDDATHLGSTQDGMFVWHLYKENNVREF